ncbi:MAG: tyrosine--tRNA ligase [Chlamydiales bacterium]
MNNPIRILRERGLIESVTSDEIEKIFDQPQKVYCGFDPTSDSLHLGNLVAIMGLAWFYKCGHTPIAVVGGATGMVGDPSGKSQERPLLDEQTIGKNLSGIRKNIESIFTSIPSDANLLVLNNMDWIGQFTFLEFLRDVGKHFRLGPMLAKESVRNRLNSEEGMSFTEFSYQLIQGYDFLYLFNHYGVKTQMGGSDQWGNITAGTELIRKLKGQQAYGLTLPLLTSSEGKKLGKTEKGAIWLSPEKLSTYEFYQYLYRTDDRDVIKLLRMLTFMDMEEIRFYENKLQTHPNLAQKRLAEEVTRTVRGNEELTQAIKITEGIKPGSEAILDADALETIAEGMPSCDLYKEHVIGSSIVDLLVLSSLQTSKGQAKRLIQNGGAYLNNKKIDNENTLIQVDDLIEGKLILLSAGKKNRMLIRIKDA